MARPVNAAGVTLLRTSEGCRLYTYDDATGRQVATGQRAIGRLTAGCGHTGPDVIAGMTITQALSDHWEQADLQQAGDDIERLISVRLTDNQFAALCVFRFNIGVSAFAGSTLRRLLNKGRYDAVPSQLARWTKAAGKVVPGLVARRAREAQLWSASEWTPVDEVVTSNETQPVQPGPSPSPPSLIERVRAWFHQAAQATPT